MRKLLFTLLILLLSAPPYSAAMATLDETPDPTLDANGTDSTVSGLDVKLTNNANAVKSNLNFAENAAAIATETASRIAADLLKQDIVHEMTVAEAEAGTGTTMSLITPAITKAAILQHAGGGSMVYPGPGIAVAGTDIWETSLTYTALAAALNGEELAPTGNINFTLATGFSTGPLCWEGATVDAFDTCVSVDNPTAGRLLYIGDYESRVPAYAAVSPTTGYLINSAIPPQSYTYAVDHTLTTSEAHGGLVELTAASTLTLPTLTGDEYGWIIKQPGGSFVVGLNPPTGEQISLFGATPGTVSAGITSTASTDGVLLQYRVLPSGIILVTYEGTVSF